MKILNIEHLKKSVNNKNINKTNRNKAKRKLEILERDRFRCVLCNSRKELTLHHVNGGQRSYNTSSCYNPKEVITLCKRCHGIEHRFKRS